MTTQRIATILEKLIRQSNSYILLFLDLENVITCNLSFSMGFSTQPLKFFFKMIYCTKILSKTFMAGEVHAQDIRRVAKAFQTSDLACPAHPEVLKRPRARQISLKKRKQAGFCLLQKIIPKHCQLAS